MTSWWQNSTSGSNSDMCCSSGPSYVPLYKISTNDLRWFELPVYFPLKCRLEDIQNGRTVLPVANLMADSESKIPISHLLFTVSIDLSCLVSETFTTTDRQMAVQTMAPTLWKLRQEHLKLRHRRVIVRVHAVTMSFTRQVLTSVQRADCNIAFSHHTANNKHHSTDTQLIPLVSQNTYKCN